MKDLPRVNGRPGEDLEPLDFESLKTELSAKFPGTKDTDVMSAAMYPKVARDFFAFRETYGPVDKLETRHFLTGPDMGEEFEV